MKSRIAARLTLLCCVLTGVPSVPAAHAEMPVLVAQQNEFERAERLFQEGALLFQEGTLESLQQAI